MFFFFNDFSKMQGHKWILPVISFPKMYTFTDITFTYSWQNCISLKPFCQPYVNAYHLLHHPYPTASKKINLISDQDLQNIRKDEEKRMQTMSEDELSNISRITGLDRSPTNNEDSIVSDSR